MSEEQAIKEHSVSVDYMTIYTCLAFDGLAAKEIVSIPTRSRLHEWTRDAIRTVALHLLGNGVIEFVRNFPGRTKIKIYVKGFPDLYETFMSHPELSHWEFIIYSDGVILAKVDYSSLTTS